MHRAKQNGRNQVLMHVAGNERQLTLV
jgi:hypothetical protein